MYKGNERVAEKTDEEREEELAADEAIVTACSFLRSQADLEREAAELLPGKMNECTFDQGYVHQPVYACLTCTRPPKEFKDPSVKDDSDQSDSESTDPAGMCYSCSVMCHADHNVIEIFQKRNFRCDCGTKRLAPGSCQLKQRRTGLARIANDNEYGHNFWGFYCRCNKLYDNETDAEMVQCYVCSEWFHMLCIGDYIPDDDSYEDYVCRDCVGKHAVIRYIDSSNCTIVPSSNRDKQPASILITSDDCSANENSDGERPSKKVRQTICQLSRDKEAIDSVLPADMFMADGWRGDVCKCEKCMGMIRAERLEFLINGDPVVMPGDDQDDDESMYEAGMRVLRNMDPTVAIDMAGLFQRFCAEFKEFARPFAESGTPISKYEIENFFQKLKSRKDVEE
ncbi:hypothetical protein LPJ73_000623 [Coemansia sp. RSA 2703]|nr:hypothetical protein LPJ73_000623 [Coemansia sp. RSA 2703]KAJ2375230.1 hypothetical protein IW150_002664 [Coemansia sp. RSA 2607]KAJ2389957.1 hypothetical protein GGI05_003353 [Coemansia sp. RSA 2603]